MCIFDHANPKTFKHLLICMNLYQHPKTPLIPLVQSWNTANFGVQRPDWSYPFLTMPHQKIYNQLLIFVNFYQLAKNEAVLSTCSGEIIYIKNPAIWLAESILLISKEKDLSQIKDLCMNTANNKNLPYRAKSVKINNQFVLKTLFLTFFFSISPILGIKKVFPKNQAVMHNFIRVSGTTLKFREI